MKVTVKDMDYLSSEKNKVIAKLVDEICAINFEQYMIAPEQLYIEFEKCGFIEVIPPIREENKNIMVLGHISLESVRKGRTVKPGNIILNIRCLIDSLPAIAAFTVSMINDIPILKVCSALSLWKEIKKVSTIEINRNQSIVIIALWKYRDHTNHISLEYGFDRVNFFCKTIEEKEISWDEYNRTIDDLLALRCIDMAEGIILLRETVSKEWQS